METINVHHLDGDRFAVLVRDHLLTVDQPFDNGGSDSAPTPTELFVAALAACVGYYARRYLARHQLPNDGLTVTADFAIGAGPQRVTDVRIVLGLPEQLPAERRAALLAVASHCTVHNSLRQPPEVSVSVAERVMSE